MSEDDLIVFDGVCVLCSGWVQFVLKHDHRRRFKLAAMQTPTGRTVLIRHGIDPDDPATFLVIKNGVAYTDTDALIQVLSSFSFVWRVCARLMAWVPRTWRNTVYRYIARNRYRMFGRRDTCLLPSPRDSDRFLP